MPRSRGLPMEERRRMNHYLDDEAADAGMHHESDGEDEDERARMMQEGNGQRKRVVPEVSELGHDLSEEEIDLFKVFVKHSHQAMGDWDEDYMGRLVALIATFGGFKPKKTFRFIASCCPNYVTGQFLARLQESGIYLKAKHALQLVEAGVHSKEDLLGKVVDLVDHHILDLKDNKTALRVAGTFDGQPFEHRIKFTNALCECTRSKEDFLQLLSVFVEGMSAQEVAPFLEQVAEETCGTFHDLDDQEGGRGGLKTKDRRNSSNSNIGGGGAAAAIDRNGIDSNGSSSPYLAELRHHYPDLELFFKALELLQEEDEEEADDDGNLRDFVIADGEGEEKDDEDGLGSSSEEDDGDTKGANGSGKRKRKRPAEERCQHCGGSGVSSRGALKGSKRKHGGGKDKQEDDEEELFSPVKKRRRLIRPPSSASSVEIEEKEDREGEARKAEEGEEVQKEGGGEMVMMMNGREGAGKKKGGGAEKGGEGEVVLMNGGRKNIQKKKGGEVEKEAGGQVIMMTGGAGGGRKKRKNHRNRKGRGGEGEGGGRKESG